MPSDDSAAAHDDRSAVMKRFALCIAAAAGAGAAGAQPSSVTVFGIVDLAVRSVTNDDTVYQLASGGLQASRLGVRATEDLGGGLSAGFWLEGALSPDDGNRLVGSASNGSFSISGGFDWRRRSTVSLIDRTIGELRLGRDKVPSYYEWEDYDPFGASGLGASTRMQVAAGIVPAGGAYGTAIRADNLVNYYLPGTTGGVFGQAGYAFGEGEPGNAYVGGRIGYRSGPLMVSGSYGQTEVTGSTDADTWAVGASYDFGIVKLMGFYASLEIGSGSQDNWLIGATAPIGAVQWRVSYQSMDGGGTLGSQDAKMIAVGGSYLLSKRTALYATYAYIDNDGTRFTVGSGSSLTAGNSSKGFDVGVRHSF